MIGSLNQEIFNSPMFFILLAWSIIWKGVAMWQAARRGEKKWFIAILLVNSLAILEIIYLFIWVKKFPKEIKTPA